MNEKDLFRVFGDISDDLIMEAAGAVKKARRIKMLKIIAVALAFAMLTSFTVWAAGIILSGRSAHSWNIPDYNSVPSQETLQKDIGIGPKIPESFSNGFTFRSGYIVENEDYAGDGSVFEQYRSLSCEYLFGENRLTLIVDASIAGIQMEDAEIPEVYKKSEIKYDTYTNKIVPGNYRLTEQDERDQASGKYVFSFGSDAVEIHEVQILGWEYGGLSYTICIIDSSVTKGELIQMAKELIDAQNK